MTVRSLFLAACGLFPIGISATQAEDMNDNVVVIDVAKVSLPKSFPGVCKVRGMVAQVRAGSAFHYGQAISISVPCGSQVHREDGPGTSDIGPILQDAEVLRRSKSGYAHLTNAGALKWQPSQQSYGIMGRAVGYRVLDGVSLKIAPASPI